MSIEKYIKTLSNSKIYISANNGKLNVKGEEKSLTPEVLSELKSKKDEILAFYSTFNVNNGYAAIPKAERKEHYAMSPAQRRMYFLQQLDPDATIYNMPQAIMLRGVLDFKKLQSVFNELIQRHESLRTYFQEQSDEVFQKTVDHIDFKLSLYESGELEVPSILDSFIQPFELSKAPLFRAGVISLEAEAHVLIVDMHHIISDGTSQGILIKDFMALYTDQHLVVPKLQYTDFSEWQMSTEKIAELEGQKQFWMDEFAEEVSTLNLPTDFVRPLTKDFSGRSIQFEISQEQTTRLRSISEESEATMFMTVLSLLNILLSKLSSQEDIVIGTPVSGREHSDLEGIIGMFVNTLPIRNYPKGELKFIEFLSMVKETSLACFENQSYPYEELVEGLKIPRDTSRNPLFDILFSFQNFETESLEMSDVTFEQYDTGQEISKFDLTFTAAESKDQLLVNLEYSSELFSEATIKRFVDYFKEIVETVTSNSHQVLSQIELLSPAERTTLLHKFNDNSEGYEKNLTIVDLFERQVTETPKAIGLIHHGKKITYTELNNRSNQLANQLKEKGIGRNMVVGIMLDRSFEMIVSIIAILKSGAAYLPVDADYPESRISFMLTNSEVSVLLTDSKAATKATDYKGSIINVTELEFSEGLVPNLPSENEPTDLFYVIYTSGSTGIPKGVMLKHSNLTNLVHFDHECTPIDFSCVLQFTTLSFDPSFREIFSTLLKGGQLVLADTDDIKDVNRLFAIIKKNEVRTLFMPGSLLNQLFNDPDISRDVPSSIRHIVSAGEQTIVGDTFKGYLRNQNIHLYNHYGPSETQVITGLTIAPSGDIPTKPCIGGPICNTQIYILDTYNNLQPIGVPGELYAGGDQVGLGYYNNTELTADRFVPNPFCEGEKLYRTGDMARWLPDGTIEFIGRIDHQVKIRGFRVELGEIESRLSEHDQIKEAVVVALEQDGEKHLVSYYVCASPVDPGDLRDYLSEQLPDFMVPGHFMPLEELPVTLNGKIDKKSLPAPEFVADADYVAPSSDMEHKLVDIWSDILKIDKEVISIGKSFFALGGHSLKAMVLVNRILKAFNVSIPLRIIFNHQDIESLTKYIGQSDSTQFSGISPAKKKEHYVFSPSQRRVHFLYEYEKDSLVYNMPQGIELQGDLDVQRLEKTFKKLIDRHEALRTSFIRIDESVVQEVHDYVDFQIDRLTNKGEDASLLLKEFIRPFDLTKAPLLRVALIKVSDSRHILLVDMHHIIADGVSQSLLIRDFTKIYTGQDLPPVTLQYKDYAEWQASKVQQQNQEATRDFWLKEFSEDVIPLNLPQDFSRKFKENTPGAGIAFTLGQQETDKLRHIVKDQEATMFMVVLSIFNVLLSKLSNSEDITIGTPVAGRNHADMENIMGMFVNTVVLRNRPRKTLSFKAFLSELKEKVIDCFENQSYQYEELIGNLNFERDFSRNPLFDVMFIFQNYEQEALDLPGLEIKPYDTQHRAAKFDLTFTVTEMDKELEVNIEYSSGLFREETILRFVDYFKQIIDTVTTNIDCNLGSLNVLSESETKKLLHGFNSRVTGKKCVKTLIGLFEDQVVLTPHKTAITFDSQKLTYREFYDRVDQVVYFLKQKGIGSGDLIGIMCPRSFDLLVSIFGVLKAGAAYLPIDPGYPEARVQQMLNDSGISIVLTLEEFRNQVDYAELEVLSIDVFEPNEKAVSIESMAKPADLAYVIYTSGSTGTPKGMKITHGNLSNFMLGIVDEIPFESDTKILSLATISFDIFIMEAMLPLTRGMEVIMATEEQHGDPALICKLIEQNEVDMLQMTPSRLKLVQTYDESFKSLRSVSRLMVGGEPFPEKLLDDLKGNYQGSIYNLYGPSETTVWSTVKNLTNTNHITIGKGIANVFLSVLDSDGQLLPLGVSGELCIGGKGVAAGYFNNNELSNEKFVPNPFDTTERLYKTGDLARWLPNGELVFMGRFDEQVKIRGNRVELGDIESCLVSYEGVDRAVALVVEGGEGQYLILYYVSLDELSISELQSHLSEHLPAYMMPTHYVHLTDLPMTPNGKVDRRALPPPELMAEKTYEAPSNDVEQALVEVWSEVLALDKSVIGMTQSFFALGGHSLSVAIMLNKVHKEFALPIPLKEVFKRQTIRQLSNYIIVCKQIQFDTDELDEMTI